MCCWITPVLTTVPRGIMPKGQNAITAQLTVETALKMACAKVSILGENSWMVVERTGGGCCF